MLLDFKDITLTPRVLSTIKSRDHIEPYSKLGNHKVFPIIASPMKDVCDGNVANIIQNLGYMGIVHRFSPIDEQVSMVRQAKYAGAAVGTNGDYLERFDALKNHTDLFCIDVANGFHINVKETVYRLLDINKNAQFIVGNVGSREGFCFLQDLPNVVGIRVGIGGGAGCTTKNATGVLSYAISLILECKHYKKNAAIIYDGGIKESRDFCKAIAVGADFVMMGSALAVCEESPAEVIQQDGEKYKLYHGSASFEIQKLYRDSPRYVEGRARMLPFNNQKMSETLSKFMDGLKSSMSYFNSLDIETYHKNITWDVVS